ncbi:MAG: aminotransferase class V-fold PLP-dependent enzyme [Firmicutes bacterium]|nr:aminotransferase class V-fold PLP-dependent enzyme [Bacillota bacterium]
MIYLDNAATSFPKPDTVPRAVCGVISRLGANPGRSGHRMSLAAGRIVMNCREALAQMLCVKEPERIIFCFNCTDALNMAIHGVITPGAHVIATALDHNASLRPLSGLSARGVITLTILYPEGGDAVTAPQVREALTEDTRLVVCSHGSNVTGAVQPVHEIGALLKEHGIPFLVDAAQTMGVLPVHPEEMAADMVAFPGHKGLLGPTGTGALWIREGLQLTPFREGGTGSRSDSVIQPDELPDRFESGTLNLCGIAGLLQGIRFVQDQQRAIAEHEAMLAYKLRDGLSRLDSVSLYGPKEPLLGVVSFNVEGKRSGEVAEALDRYGLAIRAGLHCAPLTHQWLGTMETGAVRVSPGFFNYPSDIDRLLSIVERL